MQKQKKSHFFANLKRSWVYIKSCKSNLIGYIIISISEAIIGVMLPIISAKVILNMTNGVMNQLVLSALLVFGIEFALYILYYFESFFHNEIFKKVLVNLQIVVAKKTLDLELEGIDKASSGLFIERLNNDTSNLSGNFIELFNWISHVISNIGVLVAILILNKYLFVYALISSICIYLINKKRLTKQYEIQKKLRKNQEKQTGLTGELVRGIRDIKVLNASDTILKHTTTQIKNTSIEELKMVNVRRIYQYFENNVNSLSNLFFIIVGVILYNNALLTIPTFIIIYNYQSKVKNLLNGFVQLMECSKRFVVASDRIFEIIENDKFKKETFGTISINKLSGHIAFDKVKFGYDKNHSVVNEMNFEIKPNEKVAFVGKSGAGKTTIFNLITKLYNIDSGKILLDGYNINDLDCNSIRNNMSMIMQDPYIFNFSIKDNLLLARENASMEEIRTACRMACIDDFIMSLPDKYETMVGENGVSLSGGQKQRLAIARALLMKTEIILLDEATSALDNETQSEVQNAIENLKGEYTILIIAHRLSTVIDCDKIFVVDDGKIIDNGTHQELLKKCDVYKTLYEEDLKQIHMTEK